MGDRSAAATAWAAFIAATERPRPWFSRRAEELNAALGDLVTSADVALVFAVLSPYERAWVHRRCEETSLLHESAAGEEQRKALTVSKPDDWTLPERPRVPAQRPRRKRRRREHDDEQEHEMRRARIDAWREDCITCGTTLNAFGALITWRGWGPMCAACVEADDELNAYKWEFAECMM
ncbi:hypothetical protein JKP88DRAFT_273115 [Tribonema minus]|uniref:R3H domain-containing protein n=1 Tax=Tribonema minus TaxID=303371 RepID=A0A835YWT8_9STRA|nr:hypothetical protein JKP88DRAFT_273115 [Tribonema minus]